MPDWMIYGANGYTGRLVAEEAVRRGMRPVLAGRSAESVARLGEQLGLLTRIFSLDKPEDVTEGLAGMQTVLHCAGPFSATASPMLDACIRTKTHYMDITGELSVFEALFKRAAEVREAGILAVSGVGFDVVPTDCLAAILAGELPDATHLRLALSGVSAISAGTAKTTVENLAHGGYIRENGRLKAVPAAYKVEWIPFEQQPAQAVTVALADLVTGYESTRIPNIEVFLRMGPIEIGFLQGLRWFSPLLANREVQSFLKELIGWTVKGPSEQQRREGRMVVWGEVANASGRKVTMRLHTPEAYAFTVDASLASVLRTLEGPVEPGAKTPSQAFGKEFVLSLPGIRCEHVTAL
jgi:short subunit dehydrogenase-like uncharacterized protein